MKFVYINPIRPHLLQFGFTRTVSALDQGREVGHESVRQQRRREPRVGAEGEPIDVVADLEEVVNASVFTATDDAVREEGGTVEEAQHQDAGALPFTALFVLAVDVDDLVALAGILPDFQGAPVRIQAFVALLDLGGDGATNGRQMRVGVNEQPVLTEDGVLVALDSEWNAGVVHVNEDLSLGSLCEGHTHAPVVAGDEQVDERQNYLQELWTDDEVVHQTGV